MKKLTILLFAMSFVLTYQTKGQEAFDKGKTVVTVGYGVPNLARVGLRLIYGGYQGYSVSGFGPILVKGDYGILKNLGIGAVIGYSSTKLSFDQTDSYYDYNTGYSQSYTYRESLKWTSLSLGAHANYHFVRKEKVDVYVGGGLGYTINNITYSNNDPYNQNPGSYIAYSPNAIFYAVTIGMRYYFTPNIGIYAEGGIEKGALLQGGLALKF
jgi:hypothetical protein